MQHPMRISRVSVVTAIACLLILANQKSAGQENNLHARYIKLRPWGRTPNSDALSM